MNEVNLSNIKLQYLIDKKFIFTVQKLIFMKNGYTRFGNKIKL